jgi:hypothetical protein
MLPSVVVHRFRTPWRYIPEDRNLYSNSRESLLLSLWFLAQLIFSTLKMGAIYSSETLVDTRRTAWRYIPEVAVP